MSAQSSLQTYQVGVLQTNCYFFTHTSSGSTIIIDPGDDGDFLSEQLLAHQLQPKLIFFTHGHFDHVGGGLPLFLNFQAPTFLAAPDLPLYRRANRNAVRFSGTTLDPIIPTSDLITDFSRISSLIPFPHQLFAVPGHSPGLSALYFPTQKILFAGDLIFPHGSIGRTDFPYSNPAAMKKSLAQIITLPDDTTVYPGHSQSFTLGEFKSAFHP